jgi:CTP-dependent riboflavin kinase
VKNSALLAMLLKRRGLRQDDVQPVVRTDSHRQAGGCCSTRSVRIIEGALLKVLSGQVKGGYGVARRHLGHVMHLIQARTGIGPLVAGTFNLGLERPYYIVNPDVQVERDEYNRIEFLKLQRCRIGGFQALIVRPDTHEGGFAHGPAHIELISTVVLRKRLHVKDGDIVPVEVEGDEQWWTGAK